MKGKKKSDREGRIGESLAFLVADFIYNNYLIIDRQEKIPLKLMYQEEEWVDINTNREDNVGTRYDYIPLKIFLVIVALKLKIIW